MDQLTHRTLITSPENLQYSYYLSPDFNNKMNKDVPTLMFLHGYPDGGEMFWCVSLPEAISFN